MIRKRKLCWVSEVAGITYIESPFGHRGILEARFHCNSIYFLVNASDIYACDHHAKSYIRF